MSPRSVPLVVAISVALLPACAPKARPHPRPSLLEAVSVAGAYESPARWRYHPRRAAAQLAELKVDEGTLYAGRRGERWLVADRARAAAQLAPESLISVSSTPTGWVFVGESGTAYESEQPLGPFVRSSSPLEPLSHVTGVGTTIVGLERGGQLLRSADAGSSWERVGPTDARFVGVALQGDGHGLALEVPERLWSTSDAGATWDRLDAMSVGAVALRRVDTGWILVRGVLAAYRFRPEQTPPLEELDRLPGEVDLDLGAKPPRGPDAGAMTEGRAVVVGSTYFEVAPLSRKRRQYRLVRGPIDGKLRSLKLKEASGCRHVRLAGFDRWFEIACAVGSEPDTSTKIRFLRSENGGKSWQEEDFEARGRVADLRLAVGREGELLVTGVCLPSASRRGCRPQGIHHRREAPTDKDDKQAKRTGKRGSDAEGGNGKDRPSARADRTGSRPRMELAPSAVPALRGVALALAYSLDGRTAYAVGRRSKDSGYAVFVSDDGGHSFQGRELPHLTGDGESSYDAEEWNSSSESTADGFFALTAAEDGTLALVASRWNEHLLVALDESGRLLSAAAPPEGTRWLGAVGMRALALSGSDVIAWETLDGGASWSTVGQVPVNLCGQEDDECQLPVSCFAGGCVIGDELSRIGWRGQADDEGAILLPPEEPPSRVVDRRARTPIGCVLGADDWHELDNVDERPDGHRSGIGEAVWFALVSDPSRGAAGAYLARPGSQQRVEYVSLFDPVAGAASYAMQVRPQIEGVAAVRYRIPNGASAQLTDIRLAWLNLFEGRKPVRATLNQSLPYRPGDITASSGTVQAANPALVSIASGGLYFRPHAMARDRQTTYFFDGRTVEQVPAVEWPEVGLGSGRTEMAHVDGQHIPLMLWRSGAAVARARRVSDEWQFEAQAIGMIDPASAGMRQEWNLVYDSQRAGLWVMRSDGRNEVHSAFHRFRASGDVTDPPLDVPVQLDTGDQLLACTAEQRAGTPRIVAPFQSGTRHPVLVTDTRDPLRVLLTSNAVLHGTRQAPCTVALDADLVISDSFAEGQSESAILPADDLAHSWLFRSLPDESGHARIEYRTMECKLDPGAEVPDEVYQQPGMVVTY